MNIAQNAFYQLSRNPSHTLREMYLRRLAYAIWNEDFTPDITGLMGKYAAQAGYMIDRLTRIAGGEEKFILLRRQLLPILENEKGIRGPSLLTEPLAKKWQAIDDLESLFATLPKAGTDNESAA